MELVLHLLLLFVILGSLVALELRDLLSAVIAVGVAGLGLSILFLLLGAPDIAITQVVVEVIVVTVLIRAAGRTQRLETPAPRPRLPALLAGAGVLLVALGFTIRALAELPGFGTAPMGLPSAFYLENAGPQTGATNVVTAVLLEYRALDTLGEATVILAAVVGTLVVLRVPARTERRTPPPREPGPEEPAPARRRREYEEVHHG